jgi:hypothetical protein
VGKDSTIDFDGNSLHRGGDAAVAGHGGNSESEGFHERRQRSSAESELGQRYHTASKKLSWKGSYSGLTGPATAAHFHSGEPGKNGGVAIPITPATSPLEGSATLTDAQAAELLAGKWYVNLHTEANKGGEIRGQVTK